MNPHSTIHSLVSFWQRIGLALALMLLVFQAGSLPAQASLRSFEEAPGQMLLQSRQTLQDNLGHRWQAIAFKRTRPNGEVTVALRLVGFPGTVTIDRRQPLTLTDTLGHTHLATEVSASIFTDHTIPEPHIGQYDLQPILAQLHPELPLTLKLAVIDSAPIQLPVAPAILAEWKAMVSP